MSRIAAIVVAALVLAGCAGQGREPSPLPEFKPSGKVRLAWKASTGEAHSYIFSPVEVGGNVCAAGSDGRVGCFSAANGARVWVREAGVALSGGAGAGENMILVGTTKGEVLAYGVNGVMLWRTRVSSEVLSAPAGVQSTVVVRAGDSKVFGLDAKDGRRIWEFQATPQSLTVRSNPGLLVDNGDAVIGGFPGGRMVKLGVRDGALQWDIPVATPRGDNELERLADVAGTPLLVGEQVCAVAFQGRVGCYDAAKGTQVWARTASSAGSLSADSRNVYYTEANGTVVALDKGNGASVWRQEKLLYRRVSAPAVLGDWIVVGDFEGFVHVISTDDGSFVARLATDGSEIIAAPLVIGDLAVIQTQAGGLYAIGPRG